MERRVSNGQGYKPQRGDIYLSLGRKPLPQSAIRMFAARFASKPQVTSQKKVEP